MNSQDIPDWFKPYAASFALGLKCLVDAQISAAIRAEQDAEGNVQRLNRLNAILGSGDNDRVFFELAEFVKTERESAELSVKRSAAVRAHLSRCISLADGLAAQFPWLDTGPS